MRISTTWIVTVAGVGMLIVGLISYFPHFQKSVWQKVVDGGRFGTVVLARPLSVGNRQVVVFVDTKLYQAPQLAKKIAGLGARVAVVDAAKVMAQLDHGGCLDQSRWPATLDEIMVTGDIDPNGETIVGGIDSGALLPLLQAVSGQGGRTVNLSVAFSAKMPPEVQMCPPFTFEHEGDDLYLTATPPLQGDWHAIWSDHPPMRTAKLVHDLARAVETIAQYDTPADTLFLDELNKLINPAAADRVPMAVVEIPARGRGDTVTLFYSGDGGWRDLDRIVAGKMAKQGFPVVGVDTLRTFWTHKTPEQSANELSATLTHYRRSWGAKTFVLMGYSFGADILAPVYNRLPEADRNAIRLVVMLAPSKNADFVIKVAGWMGEYTGEINLAPELAKLPAEKTLCVYGAEEVADTGCNDKSIRLTSRIELPGGHHFDEDYPKLAGLILDRYNKVNIEANTSGGR